MSRRLKILHVECGARLRGGARQVLYLAEGQKRRGHKPIILCYRHSAVCREARRRGLEVRPYPLWGLFWPLVGWYVFKAVKEKKPDIVHLQSRRGADTWGALGARLSHAKAIVISRRVDYRLYPFPWTWARFGWLCDHIIAVSENIKRVLLKAGVPEGKITVVRSSVDLSRFENLPSKEEVRMALGLPKEAKVVVSVGYLQPRKGQRFLIRAAPAILRDVPETLFLLVGDGPQRGKLAHLAQKLGVKGRVRLLGWREDVPKILAASDVLVHTALLEGIPGAAIEAGGVGLPVVAFRSGGAAEVVEHRRTGLLVEPRNVKGLAEAVVVLLANEEERGKMGEEARRRIKREFSAGRMVEENLAVYFEVLGNKGRGEGKWLTAR